MTDKEKMEALLKGETLVHDDFAIEVSVTKNEKVSLIKKCCKKISKIDDKSMLFDLTEWKIKPKEVTVTRETLREFYQLGIRDISIMHADDSFNKKCEELGL